MTTCEELHNVLKKGKDFFFNSDPITMPQNGIYVLYEEGEKGHGGDRIVRIGTDTGENQLRSRIFQHFKNENKNRSIFRKNIGRAILNREGNDYLDTWNLDSTSRKDKAQNEGKIDKCFEAEIEQKISYYLQKNFYFKLLEVNGKENRLKFEEKLIGTVSGCKQCKPSNGWLGNYSPISKIKESGLWQVQGIGKPGLTNKDIEEIEKCLVKD